MAIKCSLRKSPPNITKSKKEYGSSFSSALEQNGLTTKTFKEQIETSLLSEVALKDLKKNRPKSKSMRNGRNMNQKSPFNTSWSPKKATATTVLAELKKDSSAANFKKLAKKYSTDTATSSTAGKLSAFDNTDTSLDSTFKTAAFKLTKAGQYTTTAVKTSSGYEIIRAINIPAKGKESDHTAELKKQLYTSWESNTTVMTNVIKKVLKKANVSIKDDDLKNVLSVYLSSSSSTTTSTSN